MRPLAVIALGGNALIASGQEGTAQQQRDTLRAPMRAMGRLSSRFRLLLTHGNGPQVGHLLRANEAMPKQSLDVLVAMTQGQIGFLMESELRAALRFQDPDSPLRVATLLTSIQVRPDPDAAPDKPVGPPLESHQLEDNGFAVMETPKGVRRAVASPPPLHIEQIEVIRKLIAQDCLLICCGGGGIPVPAQADVAAPVEAVIDKDRASALLAVAVGASHLILATDVPGAALHFGQPNERYLKSASVAEIDKFQREGHFPPGSMGPKVEAAVDFARHTGHPARICALEELEKALCGRAGTEIRLPGAQLSQQAANQKH